MKLWKIFSGLNLAFNIAGIGGPLGVLPHKYSKVQGSDGREPTFFLGLAGDANAVPSITANTGIRINPLFPENIDTPSPQQIIEGGLRRFGRPSPNWPPRNSR